MKTLHLIILSALTLCCLQWGCTRGKTAPELVSAEALIDRAPDSALFMLQEIDTKNLSQRNRALHSLLFSRALDKNYIDLTSDSVVAPALDHFDRHPEEPYTMQAWYAAARVAQNAQDYGLAIYRYLQAEEFAKQANDYLTLGLIYRNIADIYTQVFHCNEALVFWKKSLACFEKHGNERYIWPAKVQLLAAFSNAEELDTAISYGEFLLSKQEIIDDDFLCNMALSALARAYFQAHKDTLAKRTFEMTEEVRNKQRTSSEWQLYLYSCRRIDVLDSVMREVQHTPQESLTHTELSCLNLFESAYNELVSSTVSSDSAFNELKRQQVTNNAMNFQKMKSELRLQERDNWILAIVCVAVTVIFLVVIMYAMSKAKLIKKQKEVETNMLQAQLFQKEIDRISMEKSELGEELSSFLPESFRSLRGLIRDFYLDPGFGSKDESQAVYRKTMALIDSYRPDGSMLPELEKYVNKYRNNVVLKLREVLGESAKPIDVAIFIYVILDFDLYSISYLTKLRPEAVYNRRTRLKTRLAESDSEFVGELLPIMHKKLGNK